MSDPRDFIFISMKVNEIDSVIERPQKVWKKFTVVVFFVFVLFTFINYFIYLLCKEKKSHGY